MIFKHLQARKGATASMVILAVWIFVLIGGMWYSVRSLESPVIAAAQSTSNSPDREIGVQGQQIRDLGRRVSSMEGVRVDTRLSVVETRQNQMTADVEGIHVLLKWIAGAVATLLLQLFVMAGKWILDLASKPRLQPTP